MSATTPLDAGAPIVRHATRCGFFMAGFGLAVWAPLVPYVRDRIAMSDATFGLLLLAVGVGSLSWMPLSGLLVTRWGIRPVVIACALLLLASLATMAGTSSLTLLALALFGFGGSLGVLDVVLNIQGLLVERQQGRRLMSHFHGMFSLGSISGALALTGLLSLGLPPVPATWAMILVILLGHLLVLRGYLPERVPGGGVAFVRPTALVLLVGAMCFVVYLAEGAVLDWSALYLTAEKGLAHASGGLGYAAFAAMVTLGRFTGGRIVTLFGAARVIGFGGALAAAGIGLTVLTEYWALALFGYALCGLGCANVSPVLISSLSRQDRLPVPVAVTAATTIGFAGVLAGPALMGAIAHFSSLSAAFVVLAFMLLAIAGGARRFAD